MLAGQQSNLSGKSEVRTFKFQSLFNKLILNKPYLINHIPYINSSAILLELI